MCGISGSGKSTHAISYSLIHGTPVVSTDNIRQDYFGDANDQTHNKQVFQIARELIRDYLTSDSDVIFDATNLTVRERREALNNIKDIPNVFKRCVVMATPKEQSILRQDTRSRKVPSFVIDRQAEKLHMPTKEEGFDEIIILYPDGGYDKVM